MCSRYWWTKHRKTDHKVAKSSWSSYWIIKSSSEDFRQQELSSADTSLTGKGEGRRGVISGVMGVACKSRVLMSNARSFVAKTGIESTPKNNER
jgi:hypothetical protein